MKHRPTPLFALGIAGLVTAVIVLMPVHPFVATWGGISIGPLQLWQGWKEVILALAALATLVWLLLRGQLRQVLGDRLVLASSCYLAFCLLATLAYPSSTAGLVGLAADSRYVVILLLGYVVLGQLRPEAAAWLLGFLERYVIAAGIALGVLGVLQVFVLPQDTLTHFGYTTGVTIAPTTVLDDNPAAPRAFATLRGPNDYGAFLILPLVLLAARRRAAWLWVAGGGAMLAGLVLSGSRSAWLGALVAAGVWAWPYRGRIPCRLRYGVAAIVLLAGLLAALIVTTVPSLRLLVFHSSPGDRSLLEGSSDAHLAASMAGLTNVVMHPLGCGLGCSGPASYYGGQPHIPENYYLQIAEELGIVGLALWTWLFAVVLRRLYHLRRQPVARALFSAGCGLAVIGLFLHVWSDDPLSLTWWGLAGIAFAATRQSTAVR